MALTRAGTRGVPHANASGHQVRRLNWGCGDHTASGWINSDVKDGPGVDLICNICEGLPFEDDSIDCAASIHALPELAYPDVVPALRELRRVLRPGGVLRLALPDLRKGIRAYLLGKKDYFQVGKDEVLSHGGRFIVHMLWYGHSRTLFTADFIEELLLKAGFANVVECHPHRTFSEFPEIVDLDNRESESLYVEATKADGSGSAQPYTPGVAGTVLEVVDVSLTELERGRLSARLRAIPDDASGRSLTITGWAIGRGQRATEVEVVSEGEVVARAPINVKRPDLAETFPDASGAPMAGFHLTLEGDGKGDSELRVQAVLEDETRVQVGTVHVRVRGRSLFRSLLRR